MEHDECDGHDDHDDHDVQEDQTCRAQGEHHDGRDELRKPPKQEQRAQAKIEPKVLQLINKPNIYFLW